jgi:hypothetical protein
MHKFLLTTLFLSFVNLLHAQNKQATISSPSAAKFSLQKGAYTFELGGFFQPSWVMEMTDGSEPKHRFNAKRSFFQIGGTAREEKLSFLIQTNFSDAKPLMDAWVAWHPIKQLSITMGQKQTFANNLEMRFREDRLQFTERSALSTQFSKTGREFGLFAEAKFGKSIGIAPMLAVTSGDGRNSFGEDSRDTDLGGLKYAARLDVYPLGYFKTDNDLFSADLLHEETLKMVAGAAWSLNKGASGSAGEGHGDFLLYNENGKMALPDYQQIYADLLAKYKGFSFLFEFVNARATGLKNQYLDVAAAQRLAPRQISSLMMLGNSYNTQLGYVTRSGYSADIRYGKSTPEFTAYATGLLQEMTHTTLGLSKYFAGNKLKAQAAYTMYAPAQGNQSQQFEFLLQMGF